MHEMSNGVKFNVRRYEKNDLPRVEKLWNNLLIDPKLSYLTNSDNVKNAVLHEFPPSLNGIVAIDTDYNLLGYIQLIQNSLLPYKHTISFTIFYAGGMHGVGIGGPLLNSALDLARELGFIRVELKINAERKGARALYKRIGFKEEAILEASYLDPFGKLRDEVILSYFLKDIEELKVPQD